MNNHQRIEVAMDIIEIDQIIKTGIFAPENAGNPLVRATFVEILICLRDLMHKAIEFGSYVPFSEGIERTLPGVKPEISNVFDLIKFMRDAACHPESTKSLYQGRSKFQFNIVYGKSEVAMASGTITSDYEDDVCLFFGDHKIYLKRQLLRAFEESKESLLASLPLSEFDATLIELYPDLKNYLPWLSFHET